MATGQESPVSREPATVTAQTPSAPEVLTRPRTGHLVILLIGTFIGALDAFLINMAIPSIQRDLHASTSAIQFMVTAYALAFGSALIVGGRLGDIYGRRQMFMIGIGAFALASAIGGIAPNAAVLVVARTIQGLAAALFTPQVLASLSSEYVGPAKAKVFSAYGVTLGMGGISGYVIGGALISADVFGLGWRICFLMNIPFALVVLALARRHVPESSSPRRPNLDLPAMALISIALIAFILPLIEGRQQGWPTWIWFSFALVIPVMAMLWVHERRVTRSDQLPLLDTNLFKISAFTHGMSAQFTFSTGMSSYMFVVPLFLQLGLGLSPLQTGLLYITSSGSFMITSKKSEVWTARYGRKVIAVATWVRILGLVLMIVVAYQIQHAGWPVWLVALVLLIDGASRGTTIPPMTAVTMSRVPGQYAGAASGVMATGGQVGGALGIALVGIVFYGLLDGRISSGAYTVAFCFAMGYIIVTSLALLAQIRWLPERVDD